MMCGPDFSCCCMSFDDARIRTPYTVPRRGVRITWERNDCDRSQNDRRYVDVHPNPMAIAILLF